MVEASLAADRDCGDGASLSLEGSGKAEGLMNCATRLVIENNPTDTTTTSARSRNFQIDLIAILFRAARLDCDRGLIVIEALIGTKAWIGIVEKRQRLDRF
jgi:hypothetical protein